jgi:hypothetical protein
MAASYSFLFYLLMSARLETGRSLFICIGAGCQSSGLCQSPLLFWRWGAVGSHEFGCQRTAIARKRGGSEEYRLTQQMQDEMVRK